MPPEIKPVVAGVLLFSLPFLSLITRWGVGLCSILFFLVALFYWVPSRAVLTRHLAASRWVLAAFALQLVVAILFFAVRPDTDLSTVEKPLRMLLGASAMLVVLVCNPDRKLLWAGVIMGAIGATILLAYERIGLDLYRPGGLVNPITAGDLLACLALMSLASSVDLRERAAVWSLMGVLAGVTGVLITGTRGCMIALALGVLIYTWHMRAAWWARIVPVGCLLLAVSAWFAPGTGVRDRAMEGVHDIQRYTQQQVGFSSLGLRLELWRAAGLLIAERPLLGAGPGQVRTDLQALVMEGALEREALNMPHFHNDALQVAVMGGVAGLLAWVGTLLMPLVFFIRELRRRGPGTAPALAGVFVTTSFLAFGLTEVIFWSVRASMFYALMMFMLMGLCLNAKEQDAN